MIGRHTKQISPAAKDSGARLQSLDGLRGLAAIVVLLHHCALAHPAFSDIYTSAEVPPTGSLWWWISATPIRLLTFGAESVVVFFVLSGMVITFPVLRYLNFNWRSYYVARTVRLWVPVAASILLATLWISLVPQVESPFVSKWVLYRSTPSLDWAEVGASLDLLRGPTRLNNPLWSIQWEFIFSLLLPVFIWIGVLLKHRPISLGAGCALVVGLGYLTSTPALMYLPVFLTGVMLALRWSSVSSVLLRLSNNRFGHYLWVTFLLISFVMLSSHWILWSCRVTDSVLIAASQAFVLWGAANLVIAAALCPFAKRALTSGVTQWLGRISFSLYLVHAPIIIAAVYLFGANQWVKPVIVAIPTSLIVAQMFYWLVERPSHKLAKKVGNNARKSWVSSSHGMDQTEGDTAGRDPQSSPLVSV